MKHLIAHNPFELVREVEVVELELDTYSASKIKELFSSYSSSAGLKKPFFHLKVTTPEVIRKRLSKEKAQEIVATLNLGDSILEWDLVGLSDFDKKKLARFNQLSLMRKDFFETHTRETAQNQNVKKDKESLFKKDVHISFMQQRLDSLLFREVAKMERYSWYIREGDGDNPTLDVAFQRDFVWSLEQKQALIISILNNRPIGTFYFNESDVNGEIDDVLYDGKQRFSAIKEFMQGEFPVIVDGKEYHWYELPYVDYRNFLSYSVSVALSTFDSMEELIKYYIVLNTSGRIHTEGDIEKAKSLLK